VNRSAVNAFLSTMALASSAEAAACWDGFVASEDDLADLMHESRRLLRCPGGGRTHFIALGESPSCRLECLALAVAEWHCQQRAIDLSGSGAEWWVQVREPFESLSIHWDCDECLKSETGRHISPLLATVTYLTSVGAPTVVLPVAADASGNAFPAFRAQLNAFASFPVRAKHLAFDGRLLHGALYDGPPPAAEEAAEAVGAEPRVTVLINLWVGRCPRLVGRLPAKLAAAIRSHTELSIELDDDEDEGMDDEEGAEGADKEKIDAGDACDAQSLRPVVVGASATAVYSTRATSTSGPECDQKQPWREFPIGSFHHPPVALRPLHDFWTRPGPRDGAAHGAAAPHFLRYADVQLRSLPCPHDTTGE
jgi:hypothetical protein